MIRISLQTDGNKVLDDYAEEKPTLLEVGVILLRLKQIEQMLIDKEFKDEFRVDAGKFAGEEEDGEQ